MQPNLHPELIWRSAELDFIENQLNAARHGNGRRAVLHGEYGSGKTRLLLEAISLASKAGVRSVYLSCRGGRLVDHLLLVSFLHNLLDLDESLPSNLKRERLESLLASTGLTHLRDFFADVLLINTTVDPQQALTQLAHSALFADLPGAIAQFVRSTASIDQPLMLTLDDIDQAGSDILAVIEQLCSTASANPVLLLMSHSDGLPESLSTLVDAVASIRQLPAKQVGQLVEHITGLAEVAEGVVDQLISNSGGHIFPMIAILQAIAARNEFGRLALTEFKIPTFDQAVHQHMQLLDEHRQQMLAALAVMGQAAAKEIIGKVVRHEDEAALESVLQRLVQYGWLVQTGQVYSFANRSLQHVIYDNLAQETRARLHLRAGNQFFAASLNHSGDTYLQSAFGHFEKSGQKSKALEVLHLAIHEAEQKNTEEELILLLKRGIEVAAAQKNGIEQAQFAEHLGDLYAAQGDYRAAAHAYGDSDSLHTTLTQKSKLGLVLLAIDSARSVTVLGKIVESVPTSYTNDLRWRLEAGLVWAYARTNHPYEALRRGRNALSIVANMPGHGDSIALLRLTLGMAHVISGETEEAVQHFDSAYGGWDARGQSEGCQLVDAVRANIPAGESTLLWLRYVLTPLLRLS